MIRLFKKNITETERARSHFMKLAEEGYEYIGAFNYKDYLIYVDKYPENGKISKHISVSRKKKLNDRDIKIIAEYFIGKNYTILNSFLVPGHIVNIWEEKDVK